MDDENSAPAQAVLVPEPPIKRRKDGRFLPGVSGCPGGLSRNREVKRVRAAARAHGVEAIQKLVELMRSGPPRIAYLAAEAILSRGFGRPAQVVEADGAAAVLGGVIVLPPRGSGAADGT